MEDLHLLLTTLSDSRGEVNRDRQSFPAGFDPNSMKRDLC